jgi:hypothetical protein
MCAALRVFPRDGRRSEGNPEKQTTTATANGKRQEQKQKQEQQQQQDQQQQLTQPWRPQRQARHG